MREGRSSPGGLADLPARVAVAIPVAAIAVAAVAAGGLVFAALAALLAALALLEAYRLLGVSARPALACVALAAALPLIALEGSALDLLGLAFAALPLAFLAGLSGQRQGDAAGATLAMLAVCVLGVVWVGVSLAHGVLLRELPHGGGLVIDVLLAVFVGDTAAHLVGAVAGKRTLAPAVSPGKTVEGLAAGLVVGTGVVALASSFQPWLGLGDALVLGLVASLAAPSGDLFESALKRGAGVKDSGRMLGPHGGVLDRIDAVLFAAVAGFHAALALL